MRYQSKLFTSLFAAMVLISFKADAPKDIKAAASEINFFIKNAGMTVDGNFSEISGDINFNPQNLAASNFSAEVAVSSINTGIDMRDNHLQEEEYFHSAKHPKMRFSSTKISQLGSAYSVDGKLTIKGTTREISFPFKANKNGAGWVLSGKFEIDRLDYNVGENSWVLGDDVRVELKVVTE